MKGPAHLFVGIAVLIPAACGGGSSSNTTVTGSSIVDYVAHWDGYAEAHTFGDGSDRVRLAIDASGQGSLEVGDLPPWPAATDPNVGPPGQWDRSTNYGIANLVAGFSYPIYAPRVEARRIRLSANYHDAWRDWCRMQTPVFSDQLGTYACAPDAGYDPANNDPSRCYVRDPGTQAVVEYDCFKWELCQLTAPCSCADAPLQCECSATACDVPDANGKGAPFVQVDAALEENDGADLVGTLAIDDIDQRFTIRLTRQ
jgi:hypothetical protein